MIVTDSTHVWTIMTFIRWEMVLCNQNYDCYYHLITRHRWHKITEHSTRYLLVYLIVNRSHLHTISPQLAISYVIDLHNNKLYYTGYCKANGAGWGLLTFLTGLCVGTALKTDDSSPMFISVFLLTVIAEYFSATFSLSFTSLLACFTSNFASPVGSDMLTEAGGRYLDKNTDPVGTSGAN